MLTSFVYSRVAVLVRHWFEIGLTDGVLEHGARLELRLLEPQNHRGTESAAQRFVIDRPVWRADLFDRLDRPAGTFSAAHFHPRFDDTEPSDRVFREELTADPWAWATDQLSDLDAVAAAAGLAPDAVGDDARDVREQAAVIVGAARSARARRVPLARPVLPHDPRRRRDGADHGRQPGPPGPARPDRRPTLAADLELTPGLSPARPCAAWPRRTSRRRTAPSRSG